MKFNPTFADGMSGSVGGLVASHNRSGPYFRTKAIPVNPNTIRQQAVRTIFGTLVQYWTMTLTPAERALWNDYAANTPVPATPSGTVIITGQNMFIRSNAVKLQIGGAVLAAAPTTYNTGEPATAVSVTTDGTADTIGVNAGGTEWATTVGVAGGASDDGDLVVYLGSTLNATRTFYKGPYQLVSATAVASGAFVANVATTFAAASNANGDPIAGQNRGLRLRMLYDDGRLSQAYDAILPVAAQV